MNGETLLIGTRGSQLALWQASRVATLLDAAGYRTQIIPISTTGDRRQNVPLAAIGGKGLFIKELEEALTRGEIDIAVHSLKDVPSIIPPEFELTGFLERGDPRDAWIQVDGKPLASLPPGSKVATGAPRRRAQLLERFPHLVIEPMRGNVDSRIRKLKEGSHDGAVLAAAGLQRLGREAEITHIFSTDEMLPAAGQGIVGLETRTGDQHAAAAALAITHATTAMVARCERGVIQQFGNNLDCHSAIAVHAEIARGQVLIRAFAGDEAGTRVVRVSHESAYIDGAVESVASQLLSQGAMELLVRPQSEGGETLF